MSLRCVETTDIDSIKDYFEEKSLSMLNYINEHMDSEYLLIYKYMTHSDLPNKGKRNGNAPLDKNYLYYLSTEDMVKIEETQNQKFESAKQSNIGVPPIFFSCLGIDQLQRRKGKQETQHEHIKIGDYANVYLVNDALKYFNPNYTRRIFDKLNKKPSWYNDDFSVNLRENSMFTPIELTHAIHGIGTTDDVEFAKLRLNVFKNDIMIILIESRKNFEKNVFIMFDKNPIFYTLLGETNLSWQKYAEKQQQILEGKLKLKTAIDLEEDEKTRKQQAKWRNLLAEEMMNYSANDGEVFCPFTKVACNYEELGTLFRASHIKPYNECENIQEAFDINNGLLLCANADAFFDKHLITISEDKELVYSFLLLKNKKLISDISLNEKIFKDILNDERMKYLEIHRSTFYLEEEKRKKL